MAASLLFFAGSCESDEYSRSDELEPWPRPGITLQSAIETAQQRHPSARCTEAGFKPRGRSIDCTVVLHDGDQRRQIQIDPEGGGAIDDLDLGSDAEANSVFAEFARLAPGISLLNAVQIGLKEESGYRAMAAALGREKGQILYQVLLVTDRETKVARIAAADGKLISIQSVSDDEAR